MAISSPPLTHSIGVAMANNQMDPFLENGTALPAKSRRTHRTAFAVRSGHAGDLIRIPVVEGENVSRADRNRRIGDLIVPASKVRRDVPVGSEVEITIHIDESRLITARAYIPVLDEEFEEVISLGRAVVPLGELRTEVHGETQRLATARQKAGSTGDLKAQAALDRIEGERMEAQVHDLLQAADGGDPDAVVECETRLLDLRGRIHAQQGRYLEAEACWLRAAQLSPGDPRVRRALETLGDERLRPPWMRAAIWTMGAAAAAILVFLVLNLGLGVADARYRAIDNHLYELEARLALQIERLDLRLDAVAPRPTASAPSDPADRLPRPVQWQRPPPGCAPWDRPWPQMVHWVS